MNLRTIAEHFEVSTNTVSRALRDKSGVSEELRAKIKAYAKQNNYIPNSFGTGLRGKSTNLIGLIIPDRYNPAYFDDIRAIEAGAAELGFNIILCHSQENIDIERNYVKVLIEKRVDGVIIVPCGYEEDAPANDYSILSEFGIPFVLMRRYIENKGYDCVKFDNLAMGRMVTEYLLSKGHSRILHLIPTTATTSMRDRVEGYHRAYKEHGLTLEKDLLVRCNISNIDQMEKLVTQILAKEINFTAICTYNDLMALGAMKALYMHDIKIPEEIAIMGADDIQNTEICLVPLTTVHASGNEIGARALKLLIDKMNGKTSPYPIIENIPATLVERKSV